MLEKTETNFVNEIQNSLLFNVGENLDDLKK